MPQTIALALFTIGAPGAIVNGVLGIGSLGFLGTVVSVGLSLGVSALISVLTPKPGQPAPEDVQSSLREAISPRMRFYGKNKASGNWLFGESKDGNLHKVLAISHGEIDGIESYWVDDNEVTLDGSGNVQESPYTNLVKIQTRLGLSTETAYSDLVSEFTEYTTDHRGDGITTLYAYQKAAGQSEYLKAFPNGKDTIYRLIFRGSKIKNLETDVVEYSDNAAAVIYDYLTSSDGARISEDVFTTTEAAAGWVSAHELCDNPITLKAGGTEAQWRLAGAYSLQERPADVLERMLVSCDAKLYPTSDGGVKLDIGQYYEPTVTISEDQITGFADLSRGNGVIDVANTIKATYFDNETDFTTADADPWVNAQDVTDRGELVKDTSFPMSPSHSQTRRLMKLFEARNNPEWVGQLTLNMGGLACVGERLIRVQYEDFGIDEVFEISDLQFLIGEEGILQGVTVQILSLPESTRAWDAATEEGVKPVSVDASEESTIPVPANFTVTIERITSGTTVVPYANLSVDEPSSASLNTQFLFKLSSDSEWTVISAEAGSETAQTSALSDGQSYDFQARHITAGLSEGDLTSTITVTPTADETAPSSVDTVVATGGVGEVDLTFNTPNSANYSFTALRRNTIDDEDTASLVGNIYGPSNSATSYTDGGLAAGDYYYWLSAANASGVEASSVASGSVTVT
jgi:hypothetical protein